MQELVVARVKAAHQSDPKVVRSGLSENSAKQSKHLHMLALLVSKMILLFRLRLFNSSSFKEPNSCWIVSECRLPSNKIKIKEITGEVTE